MVQNQRLLKKLKNNMPSELLHIYGPLSIHTYGLFIAIGLLIFTWLILRHPQSGNVVSKDQLIQVIVFGTFAGIAGGRILYLLKNWHELDKWYEIFAIWQGGLSILGCIVGILMVLPWYLKKHGIPVLPFLDLVGLYTPILQGISRIGCFFAGCCYGVSSSLPWAITYTDSDLIGTPLCMALHPTQLYSSAAHLLIFFVMYFWLQHVFKKPGQLFMSYLFFTGLQRFVIDFWRADQEFFETLHLFSAHQWISLSIMGAAAFGFLIVTRKQKS